MIKIRETRPKDFEGVKLLLESVRLSGVYFTEDLFRKLLKRNKGTYFVAEDNGRIIGNIFSFDDGGYCCYLYKLAVAPEYRRKGLATKLIKTAVKALKARGADYFFAHVNKENQASLKLMKSLGLKPKLTRYIVDNIPG